MTQILLVRCEEGIALATDSRAVAFDPGDMGERQLLTVQKLFHLAPGVIAVTGGAGYGGLLCRDFQRYIRQAGLYDLEEIIQRALKFFFSGLENIRQTLPSAQGRCDLHRIYIIIAGHDPDDGEDSLRFVLFASENCTDPLHVVQTANVVAIPRQMSIEYRLTHLLSGESTLEKIESLLESFLLKLAEADDDVGPPFYFVRIGPEGIKVRIRENLH